MYGIIYKAIKKCVLEHADEQAWEFIIAGAPVTFDAELMEQPYNDDAILYLSQQLSVYLKETPDKILYNFGTCVIKLVKDQFPDIINGRGDTLKDYLVNLPNFHNRIMLIYPELTPPEFKISSLTEDTLYLHYYTKTPGMKEFIRGYLEEIAKIFQSQGKVEHLNSNEAKTFEDVFKIRF
ncbi:heme NO-binding domain-containing protein [Flavobacterium sp. MFBS3-15]|uniref:heme NO-binding domain-containing protein n=1 Tax=Flavobacterium sp. MFBS3-15 TaxID=2989816 RepID=UPI002235F834|nr:heme NO-binding domain-containing protein [Flavobacterium sp. MFBS3-15]MCW4470816.1 heme NO-binding domain-containing protein [Flavobacterium sp. MFBS3-15]